MNNLTHKGNLSRLKGYLASLDKEDHCRDQTVFYSAEIINFI